ncbi:neutral/alkaline non-lysosomal ceramidase N-terminal domain-containing protein [Tissierella sp. MSJ-40]|uniref:Neutral/alkaline non-lysosomal ceramidase N-terminal domain-containing protein n=1 Tax=Tissierella simiarum TaxID=2841534 RepID=A0ABS6E1K9_9FIRM|nr:neutral/alkaline non-lysosomal ceramidase N-terminal domain-containing protein [Tissierella simiarum]MBU5436784.1 neutral/alkaline non-lysosomal ceramidase N-terminal domain-containing protein [Tissierella simiarum]
MKIYKGKIDITPQEKLKLGGFAHRDSRYVGVKNNLYLRVLIMEVDNRKVAIFTADILFWSKEVVEELRSIIERKYLISKENIIFSATHNHSGPLLPKDMLPELGEYSQSYSQFLKEKVIHLLDSVFMNPIDVYVEYIEDKMYFGVNRRLKENGKILMKPNYQGEIDNTCSLIKFNNVKSGKVESILINYALHANVTDDNYINTDYPGVICKNLEDKFEGSIVLFLQGFSGNIRPKLIIGEEFFRGTFETVENLGNQISDKIIKIISKNGKIIKSELDSYSLKIKMPMDLSIQQENKLFSAENNDFFLRWIKFIKEHPEKEIDGIYLHVQGIKLSRNLMIITLNGEVVTEYALYIKEKYKDINFLTLGCSNGMIGYLATREQLLEGGYESEDFIYYFGLPGKYSTEIDNLIKGAMVECVENLMKDVI